MQVRAESCFFLLFSFPLKLVIRFTSRMFGKALKTRQALCKGCVYTKLSTHGDITKG